MKSRLTTVLTTLFTLLNILPALAVEDGSPSTSDGVVVYVSTKYNATGSTGCSGALLSDYVVVTAGHCLLDETGQVSSEIYVSSPNVDVKSTRSWSKASKAFIPDEYSGSTTDGKIGNSDLGFLVVTTPFQDVRTISLASEKLLTTLKTSAAKLRVIGYGYTSDAGTQATTPNFFEGNFDNTIQSDPNSGQLLSTTGHGCRGDSGGPVLYVTATKIVLVGVLTGGSISNNCAKSVNGKFQSVFTIINRYADLAAAALLEAQVIQKSQTSAGAEADGARIDELNAQYDQLAEEKNKIQDELELAKSQLAELRKAGYFTITCVKAKQIKSFAGLKPKCPTGFKQQS